VGLSEAGHKLLATALRIPLLSPQKLGFSTTAWELLIPEIARSHSLVDFGPTSPGTIPAEANSVNRIDLHIGNTINFGYFYASRDLKRAVLYIGVPTSSIDRVPKNSYNVARAKSRLFLVGGSEDVRS
jgi:hypothetical protein